MHPDAKGARGGTEDLQLQLHDALDAGRHYTRLTKMAQMLCKANTGADGLDRHNLLSYSSSNVITMLV